MSSRKMLLAVAAIVAVGAAWYAFRPERLFVNQTVNESLDAGSATATAMAATTPEPQVLAQGVFHKGAHDTRGTASVYALPNGTHVLRLTGFETSNGPDVHVYLVAAMDATDNATVTSAGFVDIGSLKGNVGDQNYTLPAEVDLAKYRAVTIWCKRFGVNFGTAPLAMGGEANDMTTSDAMPASSGAGAALASGMFHSVSHETKGDATIYRLADGRRVLRLSNFHTSNGPDVHVYLIKASDASDNATVTGGGFVDLASLKGNVGDQNYEIPASLDLAGYRAVTIWCKRFGVNFATAPLTARS